MFFQVTTDNGGAIHECKPNGASNYPLRGGKCSIWEGGTRGTALIYAPSFLPAGGGKQFEQSGVAEVLFIIQYNFACHFLSSSVLKAFLHVLTFC